MEHMFEESLLYTTNQPHIVVFGGDDDHQLCKTLLLSKGHKIIYVGFSKEIYPSIRYISRNLLEPIRIDGDISEVYYTLKPENDNNVLQTIKTCIIGTINVLEFAIQKQAKVILSKPVHFEYMNICETIIQEYVEKHGLKKETAVPF